MRPEEGHVQARRAATLLGLLVTGLLASCVGAADTATPAVAGASPASSPTPTVLPTPSPVLSPSPAVQTYVIASGDTFARIAAKFGVTVDELQAANPSIDNLNKIRIGQVINVAVPSIGTVIRIEGPDYLHPRLNAMPELVLIADPSLAGEVVEWQSARNGGTWQPYWPDVITAGGRASMRAVDAAPGVQKFRARIPESSAHPELRTQTVTIEWGGSGPCPAEEVDQLPRPVVAANGTTYELVPTMDSAYNSQWSLVASNIGGKPGTGWTYQLESCWEPDWPAIAARDGTAYLGWRYVATGTQTDRPTELVVAGPEGVRTRMQRPGYIEQAPDGTVFVSSMEETYEAGHEPVFRSISVAALGPDGHPKPGWPFTTTDPSSRPVFGPDGTVYLAQSTDAGDRVIALGRDGQVKPGWPYQLPGELTVTPCGAGCANVPDSPIVTPDGYVLRAYFSGIYLVGPDGDPKPGWPYVMPAGTSLESSGYGATPGGGAFVPILTGDGRIYLPQRDGRSAETHDDMLCLLLDGTSCPGWPVTLPGGKLADVFSVDESGVVHVGLLGNDAHSLEIRPDGTIVE